MSNAQSDDIAVVVAPSVGVLLIALCDVMYELKSWSPVLVPEDEPEKLSAVKFPSTSTSL